MVNYSSIVLDTLQASLRAGEPARLRVTSGSMRPFIRAGEWVEVRSCSPADLRRGEIILFHRAQQMVIHRVLVHRDGKLLTKGDHSWQADPLLNEEDVLGVVVCVERASGRKMRLDTAGMRRCSVWMAVVSGWLMKIGPREEK